MALEVSASGPWADAPVSSGPVAGDRLDGLLLALRPLATQARREHDPHGVEHRAQERQHQARHRDVGVLRDAPDGERHAGRRHAQRDPGPAALETTYVADRDDRDHRRVDVGDDRDEPGRHGLERRGVRPGIAHEQRAQCQQDDQVASGQRPQGQPSARGRDHQQPAHERREHVAPGEQWQRRHAGVVGDAREERPRAVEACSREDQGDADEPVTVTVGSEGWAHQTDGIDGAARPRAGPRAARPRPDPIRWGGERSAACSWASTSARPASRRSWSGGRPAPWRRAGPPIRPTPTARLVEQDPADWWDGVVRAVRQALAEAGDRRPPSRGSPWWGRARRPWPWTLPGHLSRPPSPGRTRGRRRSRTSCRMPSGCRCGSWAHCPTSGGSRCTSPRSTPAPARSCPRGTGSPAASRAGSAARCRPVSLPPHR